jgi:Domain of unknown function (DUF1707)
MRPDASWATGRPDLRASDAERERIAAFLRDQAAEGRLTHEELEDRVGAAYQAVTVRELQRLVADLPRSPLAPPPDPATPRAPRTAPDWRLLAFVVLALVVAVPGLMWAVGFAMFAGTIALVAVVTALGITLGPFVLLAAAAYALLRRRELPARPLGRLPSR